MDKLKLRQSNAELQGYFDKVAHKTFQKGRKIHWHTFAKNGGAEYATLKSFCWLYCWAKTGQGSDDAKQNAKQVFDATFHFPFSSVDSEKLYELAKRLRYKNEITSEDEKELNRYLPTL